MYPVNSDKDRQKNPIVKFLLVLIYEANYTAYEIISQINNLGKDQHRASAECLC